MSGIWAQVGKSEFAGTSRLLSTNDALYSIEKDGSLYRIDPVSGAWAQVGAAGSWKNTIAAVTNVNTIYTIESGGGLYETNSSTGVWRQIGKADFGNTMYLFYANGSLYTMEKAGLYGVNAATGTWVQIDK